MDPLVTHRVCRRHTSYNVSNNQQDATTYSFINLFNSALHVSGYRFAHPREHFMTVYAAFGTMHRHYCRPVPRLRWNVSYISTATIYSFISLFNSVLHVSGDIFAHHQEHFLTVYTAFGTVHRHCCRAVHCTKSCIDSQQVLLMMGEFVARNM